MEEPSNSTNAGARGFFKGKERQLGITAHSLSAMSIVQVEMREKVKTIIQIGKKELQQLTGVCLFVVYISKSLLSLDSLHKL